MDKRFSPMARTMHEMALSQQEQICRELEALDGGNFSIDHWDRDGGGGGQTRILNSDVFEKAAVNVSAVHGELSLSEKPMFKEMLKKANAELNESNSVHFFATGISLIVHPHSPLIPTTHANYRYFECIDDTGQQYWWFGGGADLTPYYLVEDHAMHFHQVHKSVCDDHDPSYYPRFKTACDKYFYIPHRKEHRGIGGIFFDYLNQKKKEELYHFASSCAAQFTAAYCPIVETEKDKPFTEAEKHWQLQRRGRYVEFNLVYDRGTLFGLKTGGRIESILASLPQEVRWDYNHSPKADSPEQRLLDCVKTPRNWV